MNTNVIQAGVQAFNEQKLEEAKGKVMSAIRGIQTEQSKIADFNRAIEGVRADLKNVEEDVITDESVMGRPIDGTSPSGATMIAAIKGLNDAKQANVKAQTLALTNRITDMQKGIKGCNERIAAIKADVAKLETENATVTQVMGS